MKLFMLKIGARPQGRLIEQHDVMFLVAPSLFALKDSINQRWAAVKNRWHIDAWREINRVGDFQIEILAETDLHPTKLTVENLNTEDNSPKLYFINLGGYLPNEFEEFHHKLLVVADSLAHAKHDARRTPFYQHFNIPKTPENALMSAVSHVDDGFKVDVDEIVEVATLLPHHYQMVITPLSQQAEMLPLPEDPWHIGYLSIKNLKKVSEKFYGS